jgi:hypothetical protein
MNVAPIEFENAEIQVEVLDYGDHERLSALRDAHYRTHVFKRQEDQIICVPLGDDMPSLGGRPDLVSLHDDLPLCCTIIRNSLINYFYSLGRRVLSYRPIKFVAGGKNDDLLSPALLPGLVCPDWLAVNPLFEASVREFQLDRQPPFAGLALDMRTTRSISRSCGELVRDGFDIRGLYVRRRLETTDPRVVPRHELIGRVESVRGDKLRLADTRSGEPEFAAADECYLESRHESFDRCLTHAFKVHGSQVKARLQAQLTKLRRGPERLERLGKVLDHLAGLNLEMVQGVRFTLRRFLAEGDKRSVFQFPPVQQAPGAVYIFDPNVSRTCTWPVDAGLNQHGPYSSRTFTPTRPKVCVICQKSKKGQVEQFLRKLKYGVPRIQGKFAPFEKGLLRKYAIEDLLTEFFTSDDDSPAAYKRAIRQALDSGGGPKGPRWDLALVQTDERFHDLYRDDNPYLVSKSEFLLHQIPVQEFEIETANLPDYNLQYALNNMSLAIYAKLGGTPWLIKSDEGIAHELVIGLGSAHIGESRLGESERVVGITTVFTGDGNYCISNLSRAVAFEDYKSELLATLRTAVNQVRQEINWQARDPVRLIFHAFKPLRDAETEAVKALMEEMGEYDVEYAFLHIKEDHPYLLFDKLQQGERYGQSRKGVMGPTRGMFFRLSDHDVLLSLTGYKEVKRPEDGIPHPILLTLHRHSTFVDTTYLARQVYTFASHSWQGFFPSDMPVTIHYSGLIARLLGQLSTLPNWNANAMLGRIGWTRWFL